MKEEKKKFITKFEIFYIKKQIMMKEIVKIVCIIKKKERKVLNYI